MFEARVNRTSSEALPQTPMQYYVIVPQGCGQLGEGTVMDKGEITRPTVMLEHMPLDELTEVGGTVYLATDALAEALAGSYPGCFGFEKVYVYKDLQFDLRNGKFKGNIPSLNWLKIRGTALKDDFGLHKNYLVVSDAALQFLKQFNMKEWEVARYEDFQFSWEERKKQLLATAREKLKGLDLAKFPMVAKMRTVVADLKSSVNHSMKRDKNVQLYLRRGDGIYVIPNGITIAVGASIFIEPFEYLPVDSTLQTTWEAIEKALQSANRLVPHPRQQEWDKVKAWYEKAGVKTWSEFIRKAKIILSVTETESEYVFKHHYRDRGTVISDSKTKQAIPRNAPREVIIATLNTYFTKPYRC